jgi:hypothetical protein
MIFLGFRQVQLRKNATHVLLDRSLRRSVTDQREQLDGVASLCHDLEARAFEQTRQPLAEQQLVFRQHYPQARLPPALSAIVGRSRLPTVSPRSNAPEDESIVMVSIIG